MKPTNRRPVHPGKVLWEEFLKTHEPVTEHVLVVTIIKTFAVQAMLKPSYVLDLCIQDTDMTPDTAKCLAAATGTTAEFWLNLQDQYDEDCARCYGKKDTP